MPGVLINEGYSVTIQMAGLTTLKFYEREVTPPALGGRGGIPITTQRNTAWMTQLPKKLKQAGALTLTVTYNSDAITDILAQLQVNQQLTVNWPDGSKLVFYGWLDHWVFSGMSEGNEPTATVTFEVSNWNSTTGAEAGPTFTPAA